MTSFVPGPSKAGGLQSSQKSLPMGKLKNIFIRFLEQQEYEVLAAIENVLNAAVLRVNRRDSSPCLSACSSSSYKETADSFKIVKEKKQESHPPVAQVSSIIDKNDDRCTKAIDRRCQKFLSQRVEAIAST
ncbi:hypothetical protein EVAR_14219_1 [Eumeta japonica]|uniref:Uncharacterized protein n=1 Tax=Eumeta variegata TaxID=151549 RepID=A0A4C1UEL3_EUMVA|nr:hypothetical protein EVAR_14219_1 [Eumeta japonica]